MLPRGSIGARPQKLAARSRVVLHLLQCANMGRLQCIPACEKLRSFSAVSRTLHRLTQSSNSRCQIPEHRSTLFFGCGRVQDAPFRVAKILALTVSLCTEQTRCMLQ